MAEFAEIIRAVGDSANAIIVLALLIVAVLSINFFQNEPVKFKVIVFCTNIVALVVASLLFFFSNRIVVYDADLNNFALVGCLPFLEDRLSVAPVPEIYLEKLIEHIDKNTEKQSLIVVGYPDRDRTSEYGLSLAQRRAEAAVAFLVGHGFNPGAIERTTSVGKNYEPLYAGNLFCGAWVSAWNPDWTADDLGRLPAQMMRDVRRGHIRQQ